MSSFTLTDRIHWSQVQFEVLTGKDVGDDKYPSTKVASGVPFLVGWTGFFQHPSLSTMPNALHL